MVMIERGTVGGTCVNTGCVPSKALLAAPIIAYSRLLSDETLATLRTYTEYVARRRNPT